MIFAFNLNFLCSSFSSADKVVRFVLLLIQLRAIFFCSTHPSIKKLIWKTNVKDPIEHPFPNRFIHDHCEHKCANLTPIKFMFLLCNFLVSIQKEWKNEQKCKWVQVEVIVILSFFSSFATALLPFFMSFVFYHLVSVSSVISHGNYLDSNEFSFLHRKQNISLKNIK